MMINIPLAEGQTRLTIFAQNKTEATPQLMGISFYNNAPDVLNGVSNSVTLCQIETINAIISALENAKRVWLGEEVVKITDEEMKVMQDVK